MLKFYFRFLVWDLRFSIFGIGELVTGAFNSWQHHEDAKDNAAQADLNRQFQEISTQKQMAFQKDMSGSAYQRAVADLKAADLNPMLAYQQGGASTPAGASSAGSLAHPTQSVSEPITSSARTNAFVKQQIANLREEHVNLEKSGKKIDAETANTTSQALVNAAMVPKIQADTATSQTSASLMSSQRDTQIMEFNKLHAEHEHIRVKRDLSYYDLKRLKPLEEAMMVAKARLLQLEIPRARNVAGVQDSWWMKEISPYLSDSVRGITSGLGLSKIIGNH